MTKLNVYLNFSGNAEEVLGFYKGVFGGGFSALSRFKDMPMGGAPMRKEEQDKIMHVALPVGNDVLMASDVPASFGRTLVQGNSAYIAVQADSKDEAGRIFKALAGGGQIETPIADQPWGDYYGSLADKFGVHWMVIYTPPKKS
jgi:PhnB protein